MIPEGVTSIGTAAFDSCSGLTSITIPTSVTSIGNAAFSDCSSLTSITIPASVTSIGDRAFWCSSLMRIDVAEGNTAYSSVDGVLFDKALSHVMRCPEGKVEAFTIPISVTSIGDEAFRGCSGLRSLTIPESVISIGVSAFWECSKLTMLIFEGHAPTQINEYVFYKASPSLVIYYREGTTGWTNPWQGIKTQMIKKD